MTPEQRNLLLTILAVILIAGAYYYKSKKALAPALPVEENNPVDTTPKENTPTEPSPTVNTQPKISTTAAKFNLAMKNAQIAFTKGEYAKSLSFYKEALTYRNSDLPYSGMFSVYSAQMNWVKAEEAINTALGLNPRYTEYWMWKLTLLDERTDATFLELKQIYQNGLVKGDVRTKINLVIHFARIAEDNGERAEAIAVWEYAKEVYSAKSAVYQAEIDRLRNM